MSSRVREVAAVIIDNFNNLLFEGKTKTARSNCADILSKLTQEHELVMVLSQFSQTATDGHVLKSLQKLVDCKFRLQFPEMTDKVVSLLLIRSSQTIANHTYLVEF